MSKQYNKMGKIDYFFAAVYQSIKSRRPDGTPYANLLLGTTGILLLDIFNVLLALQIWFHLIIISQSKSVFAFYFIFLGVVIFLLLRILIPVDQISEIEVTQKDVKMCNFFFFLFGMLSIALMMFLLILHGSLTSSARTL